MQSRTNSSNLHVAAVVAGDVAGVAVVDAGVVVAGVGVVAGVLVAVVVAGVVVAGVVAGVVVAGDGDISFSQIQYNKYMAR